MTSALPAVPFLAVLFDMDGTLVDTEPMWAAAERILMAASGLEWTAVDHAHCLGNSTEYVTDYMVQKIADAGLRAPDRADLAARFLDVMLAQVMADPPSPRDGVMALLGDVHAAGIPAALVSSSSRVLVTAVLASLGEQWFDVTITASDVDRYKPDPLPYQEAARQLAVDPGWCVAIEDSPTGTRSARAAGAFVLAVEHEAPITSAPRVHVRSSLSGVDVAELARMFEPPPTG